MNPSTILQPKEPVSDVAICFRISQVPVSWSRDKLLQQLETIDPGLKEVESELSGPFPDSNEPTAFRVAVLTMSGLTPYLESFQPSEQRVVKVRSDGSNGQRIFISIDRHFYDLTPLNEPKEPIAADVIAITGLAGHAFGSWRSRAKGIAPIDRPMWLRDFLPQRVQNARILTYGYNSSLREPGKGNVLDYRRNFKQCLENARRNHLERPLILIGHSLGGILCIQTLVELSRDPKYHHIYNCIRGLFLFATPHQGMNVADLFSLVGRRNREAEYLLLQLQDESAFLEDQRESLVQIWKRFTGSVVTFYETKPTEQVKEVTPMIFKRVGDAIQKLKRSSAQLYLPGEHRYPVDSNHADIVKFDSHTDKTFQTIITFLGHWIDPKIDREIILKKLVRVALHVLETYAIDQEKYLLTVPQLHKPENDGKYFWIFHNSDYKSWSELPPERNRVTTLVLYDSPIVEHAASYIARNLSNTSLCLYFFYRSRHSPATTTAKNLDCICTLLKQLIENHNAREDILLEFLRILLSSCSKERVSKASACTEISLKQLLEEMTPDVLWSALKYALIHALEVCKTESPSKQPKRTPVVFVFDLDNQPTKVIKTLTAAIRGLMVDLQHNYHVRMMVTSCLQTLQLRNERYHKIVEPHSQTCTWLLQNKVYHDWSFSEQSSLLFIDGKPGSGKSTLTRFVHEHLQKSCKDDSDIIIRFFYNSRDGALERNHDNMLKSLLHGILSHDESFFIHFQETYRKLQERGSWSCNLLQNVLRSCTKHPLKRRLFLVIDALDESDDRERRAIVQFLLSLLDSASNGCAVKIFLSSRPVKEHDLHHTPKCSRIVLQDHNQNDINQYAQDSLRGFLSNEEAIQKQVLEYIRQNSDGVFLWVQLVVKDLLHYIDEGVDTDTIFEHLESLPTNLEDFYVTMINALEDRHGCRDNINDGIRILQFCLFSHRAIKTAELAHALAIPSGSRDKLNPANWQRKMPLDIRKRLIACTSNFLELKYDLTSQPGAPSTNAAIQVIHQTVREFFLNLPPELEKSKFVAVASRQQACRMIHTTCIRYLDLHYAEIQSRFQNLIGQSSIGDSSLEFVEYLDTRPLIKYSLEFLETFDYQFDHDAFRSRLELTTRVQNCPPSPAFCLLKLLDYACVDSADIQNQLNILLLLAAGNGRYIAVGNVLAAGANVEVEAEYKRTALHLAASHGHEATVRVLLVEGKADIRARDILGQTALHLAATRGYEVIVHMLLVEGKAYMDARDTLGQTALHLTASHGHEATVRVLLVEGKADIDARDILGQTALHLAAMNGHEATVYMLLVEFEANIKAKDNWDHTALHRAARDNHKATVRMLLVEGNADIEAMDIEGRTALHLAAGYGHKATVRMLLVEGNADFKSKDNDGRTALQWAITGGHGKTAQVLVIQGKADVKAKEYKRRWKYINTKSIA